MKDFKRILKAFEDTCKKCQKYGGSKKTIYKPAK